MRKFLKIFSFFLPFAAVFYLMLLMVWGYFSPVKYNLVLPTHSFTKLRMEEAKKRKDVDILVLGTSHTFRGFDPRIFESSGYNLFILGTSNQTHIQTYMLVNRYLEQLNPKIVFYEVSADLFSNDGVESACDLLYNEEIDRLTYRMLYNVDLGNMKIFNTLLFNQIRQWFSLPYKTLTIKSSDRPESEYIRGGYVEDGLIEYFPPTDYSDSLRWEFKKKQLEFFSLTCNLLNAKGVKTYLIQSPISPSFYNAHVNNREFDRLMESFGDYYNYNELIQLNDNQHFSDETHLNQEGATIFSEALIDSLFR
jgi:hypothetical protein